MFILSGFNCCEGSLTKGELPEIEQQAVSEMSEIPAVCCVCCFLIARGSWYTLDVIIHI